MSKGGRREGAGRPKGVPNKVGREVREIAQKYTKDAVAKLAELAGLVDGAPAADSDAARISALRELLDRGHGKPTQHIGGDDDAPPIEVNHGATDDLVSRIARLAARSGKGENPRKS